MRRPILPILLLTASLPGAMATTQDDAGTGGDAPDSSGGSPRIYPGLGTFTGETRYGESDLEDWYHVSSECGLSISFAATSDGLWGGVYTHEGAFIQNFYSAGWTNHFDALPPGEYRLGLGDSSRTSGAASYFVTVSTAPGSGDDADTGCDAPDRSGEALDLTMRAWSGALPYDEGDKEDWYRVPSACGLILDVVSSHGGFYVGIYSDDMTRMIAQAFVRGASTRLTVYGDSAYRIGIGDQDGSGSAAYRLTSAPMNDARTGCDGSNTQGGAATVGAGAHNGGLLYALGDNEDWFRYASGCQLVKVTVTVRSGGAWAGIYTDEGTPLRDEYLHDGRYTYFLVVADAFRLGIGDASQTRGSAYYGFDIAPLATDPTGRLCAQGTRGI